MEQREDLHIFDKHLAVRTDQHLFDQLLEGVCYTEYLNNKKPHRMVISNRRYVHEECIFRC